MALRRRLPLLLAATPALVLAGCGSSDERIAALEQRVAAAEARADAADQRARKAEQLAMQPAAPPQPMVDSVDLPADPSPDLDVNHPPEDEVPLDPSVDSDVADSSGPQTHANSG
ncbi:hypothetical protein [Novosphingobium sp. FKTRR1]|uniref:hypothetical protein n=1 Tax=unclassified Novosphingobium TaxID=2644732 RepID=UPI001CEFDB3F|nr:hypothetical protein [Novosphingobium sp. FKTRR1]